MEMQESRDEPRTLTFRNRITGGAMGAIGLYVIAESLTYSLGTPLRMGPGFLPLGLGVLFIIFGALVAIVNDDGDQPASRIVWRPFVLVLSAILAFALLIEPVGLLAATAALVFISGAADPEHSWRSLTVLFVFLVTSVYIVFVIFLSIPFSLITGVM